MAEQQPIPEFMYANEQTLSNVVLCESNCGYRNECPIMKKVIDGLAQNASLADMRKIAAANGLEVKEYPVPHFFQEIAVRVECPKSTNRAGGLMQVTNTTIPGVRPFFTRNFLD